jgi:hypothetical protein
MRQLFSLKQRNTWNPAWRHSVDGFLWLFRLSPGGRIVGEVRHRERRETSYFCLDETSGRALWEGLRFDEPWWIGLEETDEERAYFHRYRKPDMPQHLGVTAVDLETGQTVWENKEVAFLFHDHGLVYAVRQSFEAMRFLALDACDGSIRRDYGTDAQAVRTLRDAVGDGDRFRGCLYPEPFGEEHPDYGAFRELLHTWCPPGSVRGNLDVLRHETLLLASWHRSEAADGSQETLSQEFLAYDTDRHAIVFSDTINTGVTHPSIDSFFVKDLQVLYVKDQHTLTAHSLTAL